MMEISDTMVISAFGSLVGAIVFLYQNQAKNHKFSNVRIEEHFNSVISSQKETENRIQAQLESCERQHAAANEKIIRLTGQVGELTGVNQLHEDLVKFFKNKPCEVCNGKDTTNRAVED